MRMPAVTECTAESCAYNDHHTCHALAITVGQRSHAECDTFTTAGSHGGDPTATGHVGACTMSDCRHNVDLECQASAIALGAQRDGVDCLTYQPS
ncbi:DUF1540 domain-containing protein [Saccharopolyspora sp. MS10]|uniref:DUF1540 domain-containing protein n=1 Tax=Saccharopolyspora sp. MS10 TaxID=3385973 RepID=UPI0039A188DF